MIHPQAIEAAWAGRTSGLHLLDDADRGEVERALNGESVLPRDGGSDLPFLALAVRNAWLRFDANDLERLAALLAPRDHSWSALAHACAKTLRGERVIDAVQAPGFASVFATVLDKVRQAVGALGEDRLDDAVRLAREAVRDAREGTHADAHTLALLALARVRRAGGRPHLTRRILSEVAHQPSAYANWRDAELFLAGQPSDAIRRQIEAIRNGRAEQLAEPGDFADLRRELTTIVNAMLGAPTGDAAPFVLGEQASLRHGIETAFADEPHLAAVFCVPNALPCRRLAPGPLPTAIGAKSAGRTEEAISALALASPEGLETGVLFRRVYGFPYRAHLHDGTFRVLLTRVRQSLEDYARLDRSDDTLRLSVTQPFAVIDPRVRVPFESPVLRAITDGAGCSARELSERLTMPLRTIQAELARLVEDGVCVRHRSGRDAAYEVEDTTFRSERVGGGTQWGGTITIGPGRSG